MKIGLILDYPVNFGGGFQQALSMIDFLKRASDARFDFEIITTFRSNVPVMLESGIPTFFLNYPGLQRYIDGLLLGQTMVKIMGKLHWIRLLGTTRIEKHCKRKQIDLLYFLSPSDLALCIDLTNYVYTVWDTAHRDHPEFPEVRNHHHGFEKREKVYTKVLPKAVAVLVDSEAGKKNVCRRYGVDEERVAILPFFPPIQTYQNNDKSGIIIKDIFKVKNDYVFYPAQFWAHKNHVYILQGLALLRDKYKLGISALFAGSDKGNGSFIKEQTKKYGLEDQVHFLGFVDAKYIPFLYKQAVALVMPTYFGPTNLPPLEAFELECPVLLSDFATMHEQAKDAALYMDLRDPESMAQAILQIINNSETRKRLTVNGKQVLKDIRNHEHWRKIRDIFEGFAVKRQTWQ